MIPGIHIEDGAKAILEVVSATGLESSSIDVEPGTPELTSEEVDVTTYKATVVVPEAEVNLGLDVKVNHIHDPAGCK